MIIYPASLLLSAAVPMTYSRIFWQTYTRDEVAVVTASSETVDGPRDMPLEPDTAGYWQPSEMPAEWVVDLGSIQDLDYVGIAGHTCGTHGATVLVETSTGSFVGSPAVQVWTTLASSVAPSDDSPLVFLDAPRTARYVRITLTGGVPPKLAVVYAGVSLAMTRGPEMGFAPATLSRTTELHNAMSSGGQFLGQGIKQMGVSGSVSFQRLQQDWYRENFDPFVLSARQYPYFFAWNPEQYELEVVYAWTGEDIKPVYVEWDFFGVTWAMQGIGNE
jgi:hypothetical protein